VENGAHVDEKSTPSTKQTLKRISHNGNETSASKSFSFSSENKFQVPAFWKKVLVCIPVWATQIQKAIVLLQRQVLNLK